MPLAGFVESDQDPGDREPHHRLNGSPAVVELQGDRPPRVGVPLR